LRGVEVLATLEKSRTAARAWRYIMSQRPIAIGLLLCERIIVEEGTRNATFVNTFSRRKVKDIPSEPISFLVVSLLTNGLGEIPLEVRIQRLDTLDIVSQFRGVVRFDDPLKEVRCKMEVRNYSFPVAGIYDVLLLVEGEMIANRRIAIIQSEEEP
jgi:hypothetical protein